MLFTLKYEGICGIIVVRERLGSFTQAWYTYQEMVRRKVKVTLMEQINSNMKKNHGKALGEILEVSQWNIVKEQLQENTYFTTSRDEETVYVGLALHLNDVGGTRKKERLFEHIQNGKIKTYIDATCLDKNKIVFIPEYDSLDMMGKFGLLVKAPLKLAFIDSHGNIECSDKKVKFPHIVDFSEMGGEIDDFLASKGIPWAESEAFDSGSGEFYVEDTYEGELIGAMFSDDVPYDEFNVSFEDDVVEEVPYIDEGGYDEDYLGEDDGDEDVDLSLIEPHTTVDDVVVDQEDLVYEVVDTDDDGVAENNEATDANHEETYEEDTMDDFIDDIMADVHEEPDETVETLPEVVEAPRLDPVDITERQRRVENLPQAINDRLNRMQAHNESLTEALALAENNLR